MSAARAQGYALEAGSGSYGSGTEALKCFECWFPTILMSFEMCFFFTVSVLHAVAQHKLGSLRLQLRTC